MTMAVGVNNSPRDPRGPERESARYRMRPTTTGGNPKVSIKKTINVGTGMGKMAMIVPIGKLIAVSVVAASTPIESEIISEEVVQIRSSSPIGIYKVRELNVVDAEELDPVVSKGLGRRERQEDRWRSSVRKMMATGSALCPAMTVLLDEEYSNEL